MSTHLYGWDTGVHSNVWTVGQIGTCHRKSIHQFIAQVFLVNLATNDRSFIGPKYTNMIFSYKNVDFYYIIYEITYEENTED